MACVINDDGKFYPQIFLEQALYDEQTQYNGVKKDMIIEFIPVAYLPKRWWDWCLSEDEKKEIDPIFNDKL